MPRLPSDLRKLEGTWDIVSLQIDGATLSAAALGGARISIRGDRFRSMGMGAEYEGTIEVDPATVPKSLNLHFRTGPEKGNTNLGIYEIEGDRWRICLATRGSKRPNKFASEPGTGIAVEVLERTSGEAVPAAEPAFENVHFEAAPELAGEWSMVSGTLDGHPLDKSFVRQAKRVVKGCDMTVTFGREVYSKAKYTVDRSLSPAGIDIYNSQGANAGKIQHGIHWCPVKYFAAAHKSLSINWIADILAKNDLN